LLTLLLPTPPKPIAAMLSFSLGETVRAAELSQGRVTAKAAAAMPVLRRKDRRLSWGVMGVGVWSFYDQIAESQVPCSPCDRAQTTVLPAKAAFVALAWPSGYLTKTNDVNRFRGQARTAAYLAVWMNLMTPLPYPERSKFRLTML